MRYDFTAIPDDRVPRAVDPQFQYVLDTYASETNKTVGMWRALPEGLLDYVADPKINSPRTILAHQLLSERRFFAQFVGTKEPPAAFVLPAGEKPAVAEYIAKYVEFAEARLPQFADAKAEWWLEERPFFGGLMRQRIWTFWRRVLHTAHHRTQLQMLLRLGGARHVPAIYGPSADVTWSEADPTYSVAASDRPAAISVP